MKKIISTDKAPQAIGPYSQAVHMGNLVFISGQIPINPDTGAVMNGGIEEQTRQSMTNLKEVCHAAGASLDHIVKTTLFLTDLNDFQAVNAVYAEFFKNDPPARSTVQVAALPLGVNIEIEAIVML